MRAVLISLAMTGAAAAFVATPAMAQRPANPRQLMARFDTLVRTFDPDHWTRKANPAMGSLRVGATDTTDLQLRDNTRHAVLGLCTGCTGLTMQVFGPTGAKLGESVVAGGTPRVEFTTTAMAHYMVLTRITGCSQAQCDIGLQFMIYR